MYCVSAEFRAGAFDFLEKPLGRDRLLLVLKNALEQAALQQENARLRGHRWPGNVRELGNAVERMAILSVSDLITIDSIPLEIRLPRDTAVPPSLEETRAQAERDLIRQALDEAGGNVSAAARALGVERPRLRKRIRSLDLKDNQR